MVVTFAGFLCFYTSATKVYVVLYWLPRMHGYRRNPIVDRLRDKRAQYLSKLLVCPITTAATNEIRGAAAFHLICRIFLVSN